MNISEKIMESKEKETYMKRKNHYLNMLWIRKTMPLDLEWRGRMFQSRENNQGQTGIYLQKLKRQINQLKLQELEIYQVIHQTIHQVIQ